VNTMQTPGESAAAGAARSRRRSQPAAFGGDIGHDCAGGCRDVCLDRACASSATTSTAATAWKALQRKAAVCADQLATALRLPLWTFDRPQIDRVIEGSIEGQRRQRGPDPHQRRPEFAPLRTRDAQGNAVSTEEKEFPPPSSFRKERPIVNFDEELGTVRVCLTPKFVEARIRHNLYATSPPWRSSTSS